jgi:spore coat protein A
MAFGPGAALGFSVIGLGVARDGAARTLSAAASAPTGGHAGSAHGQTPAVLAASPAVTPFAASLPIPPTLAPYATDATTDYYQLTMRQAPLAVLPGLQTTVWGFNGQYPGPTIRARRGRRAVVRQTNALPAGLTVHLHGGHAPASSDGHPNDLIAPGGSREYIYPNSQTAATLWYHDHTMMATAPNVYRGLAGFYLLGDDVEDGLNLPSGEYDVPLLLQDRQFNADGSLFYPPPGSFEAVHGFNGDTMLVNGAPQPRFAVARRKYRFRLLNGANVRDFTLALRNGAATVPLTQIGGDGGLLPAPVVRNEILIWPAERIEVVIDFAAFPIGAQLVLVNTQETGTLANLLRFDVARDAADTSALPGVLRPIAPLNPAAAAATRPFALAFQPIRGAWVINGQVYDPGRIDFQTALGSTEIWTFQSPPGLITHPMHMHHAFFQILDRNGAAPPPWEAGWKDTVAVGPGETVRVIARFDNYSGPYVFHCHKLEHEDHEMMGQFRVVGSHTLALPASAGGGVTASPGGPTMPSGTVVTLAPTPNSGNLFLGWLIDDLQRGWANPLTLTLYQDHTVRALFVARPSFPDVTPATTGAYEAIGQLAAREIIRGYEDGSFGPTDSTLRAQMAALIVRAMGWDAEDWGTPFTDRGPTDDALWRNVGTAAHYGVARGYGDGTYRPTDDVLNVQTIAFIARAMAAKGYWVEQPDNAAIYPNVPSSSGHREDLATFVHYAGAVRGTAAPTDGFDGWAQAASRAWFSFSLWQALDSFFGADRVP